MTAIVPAARPKLARSILHDRIARFDIDRARYPVVVVGIRGYYLNSLGKPGLNDRGLYDDALFIDLPDRTIAFNGNTDPSRIRQGAGFGVAKGMARLNPGVWHAHTLGLHKGQYTALCQRAGKVTVTRDGKPDYPETGMFGINIHRGGVTTTSSEGCQTIPPAQWPEFIDTVHAAAGRYRQTVFPYVLLEEPAS